MKFLLILTAILVGLYAPLPLVKGDNLQQQLLNEGRIPEDCQYPERPLKNGGCDNTDPCDPETLGVPGLWGDCRDTENESIENQPSEIESEAKK